jgi:hypothetical protein
MIRYHEVSQLTTAELERAKRELQANLGTITSHSRTRADPGSDAGNRQRTCRTRREPEGHRKHSRACGNRLASRAWQMTLCADVTG